MRQPVAHLSVSWNVIALPFSVVIVSNVFQYMINSISYTAYPNYTLVYSNIFKHVHVIWIALMVVMDATIRFATVMLVEIPLNSELTLFRTK